MHQGRANGLIFIWDCLMLVYLFIYSKYAPSFEQNEDPTIHPKSSSACSLSTGVVVQSPPMSAATIQCCGLFYSPVHT